MVGGFLSNLEYASSASPGHWNDPGVLPFGNEELSISEEWTAFFFYSFSKAPLIIGFDFDDPLPSSIGILKNKHAISVN